MREFHMSYVRCQVSHVTSNSQTKRPRELNFLEKVHLLPPVTRHMSRVTCHMSQSGEAIRWRVSDQCGRPRLVWNWISFFVNIMISHSVMPIQWHVTILLNNSHKRDSCYWSSCNKTSWATSKIATRWCCLIPLY